MNDDNGLLWLIVLPVLAIAVCFAYKLGRIQESHYWKAALPAEMAKLCTECKGLQ